MIKKIMMISFYVIACFYVFLMLDLFFRFNIILDTNRVISRSYNFIPFQTIWGYWSGNIHVSKSLMINNILGNIAVFVPYGLYLQVLRKDKRIGSNLLLITITSATIEIIQFCFGLGACDIDDIILNCIGGIIGIVTYQVLLKIVKKSENAKLLVAILSLIVGLPIMYIYFATLIYNW